MPDAPREISIGNGDRAVLLLHGFTGGPGDLGPLAERLADHGYRVHAPLLPGHGTTIADINTKRAEDWLDSARERARELANDHEVSIVGFSMGGLIALALAAEYDTNLRSCAVLAPPLFMPTWSTRLLVPFLRLTGLARVIGTLPKEPTGLPEEVSAKRFVYEAWPLPAVTQFERVMKTARASLPKVEIPLLALYGGKDPTAPPTNIPYLFERVKAAVKEHVVYEESGHVLPLDKDADSVVQRVIEFLEKH